MSDLSDFKRLVYEPETAGLRARIVELQEQMEAVRPYVQHKTTCILNISQSPLRESSWCDCGLANLYGNFSSVPVSNPASESSASALMPAVGGESDQVAPNTGLMYDSDGRVIGAKSMSDAEFLAPVLDDSSPANLPREQATPDVGDSSPASSPRWPPFENREELPHVRGTPIDEPDPASSSGWPAFDNREELPLVHGEPIDESNQETRSS